MRRMITESDVEKLDSIKPSEMQKLAAMQDPKDALPGFILTANREGTATYQMPPTHVPTASFWPNSFQTYIYFFDNQPLDQNNPSDFIWSASITPEMSAINCYITRLEKDGQVVEASYPLVNGVVIAINNNSEIRIYMSNELATKLNIQSGDSYLCTYMITTLQ